MTFRSRLGRFICLVAIIFAYMAIIVACANTVRDERLRNIAETVGDSPEVALRELNGISPEGLSTSDKHYRNLLIVKARDKAYIRHESDSLIMSIVDYAESHKTLDWYPEALYYAGRVYSDLGDSPTALRYFHSALDALPEDGGDMKLKSAILSQTTLLLNRLRLYDEAVSLLKHCIIINKTSGDVINKYYDILMLGDIYLAKDDISQAQKYFNEALALSEKLPSKFTARAKMYLAVCSHRNGDSETALRLISESKDSIEFLTKSTFYAYASQIYKDAAEYDSAYVYSLKLLNLSSNIHNKHIAYQILLSPDVRKFSPEDSISHYITQYASELENYLDESNRSLAIAQQANYNYDVHKKERLRAETSKRKIQILLLMSLTVMFGLLALVFYLKYRSKLQMEKLRQSLANITLLQEEIERQKDKDSLASDTDIPSSKDIQVKDVSAKEQLKISLRAKLSDIASSAYAESSVDETILRSKMYKTLQEKINKKDVLPEDDKFWDTIEEVIIKVSPDFKHRLDLLSSGKLRSEEYHTAMLIKCGATPTEISNLMSRTKSTITYRRRILGNMMFDKNIDPALVDKIIHLL